MRIGSAILGASVLVATVAFAAQRPRQKEDPAAYLPPGKAKSLVEAQCTACHELDGVIRLRKPKDDWEAIVIDMVARGAPLLPDEVDAIVAYFAEAFGPTAPPLVDLNAATKDDLVKLPGIDAAAAERLLARRSANGPFASRDEVKVVLGLDDGAFEKIKWYLRPAGKATGQ